MANEGLTVSNAVSPVGAYYALFNDFNLNSKLMDFHVVPENTIRRKWRANNCYLEEGSWDDWFKYHTTYTLYYVNAAKTVMLIGPVKIGQYKWNPKKYRPELPADFPLLLPKFFSLGQTPEYYDNLNKIDRTVAKTVLESLNDVALNEDILANALEEDVTAISLFRSVTVITARTQFRRLAKGGAKLSGFDFSFTAPRQKIADPKLKLTFQVVPASNPPTNIHVIIGRNGVGKTRLLNSMTKAYLSDNQPKIRTGAFDFLSDEEQFTNLVSVTFSAFDDLDIFSDLRDKTDDRQYAYIGLKRRAKFKDGTNRIVTKGSDALRTEFGKSLIECLPDSRISLWREALRILEGDPLFQQKEISLLASDTGEKGVKKNAEAVFDTLSSGHKIVLLTITRLVETVEEKTLVLLDEPEGHLHPPLLSAFVRALSNLLVDRNGVAIIATHSPVVLQEVPSKCVWKLNTTGSITKPDRLSIESFGENVGVLTREVFGLEVTKSGFHNLLESAVNDGKEFDEIVNEFSGEIGLEGKAILRMLIHARDNNPEN
jgi:predicted ATPase